MVDFLKMKKKNRQRIFYAAILIIVILIIAALAYFFSAPRSGLSIKAYFMKEGKLCAFKRPLGPSQSPLQSAILELLAGPKPEEEANSELPHGLKLLGLKVKGRTAIINFSRQLEDYGGGSARLRGMIAQIVYTATEVPGVDKVWIWVEGKKEIVLGGEGLVLDHPLSRSELSY